MESKIARVVESRPVVTSIYDFNESTPGSTSLFVSFVFWLVLLYGKNTLLYNQRWYFSEVHDITFDICLDLFTCSGTTTSSGK